jgi:hypothetical protein
VKYLGHAALLLLALWGACLGARAATIPVLAISETPETQYATYTNGPGAYMFTLEHFLSPQRLLTSPYAVTQVGWLEAGAALAKLPRYRAVIIWDAPTRITDARNSDPHYRDLTVLSDAQADALKAFVASGGTLIVAGGVTNYGKGHGLLGSADGRAGNKRAFFGIASSPLAAILPVEIPATVTLRPFLGTDKQLLRAAMVGDDAMTAGLDFSRWGFSAYHKVKARAGAETVAAATNGDPLVVRWPVGKGRVICVMAAPRGNALVAQEVGATPNPLWEDEGVFWDRCLRWGLQQRRDDPARDAQLRLHYQALTAPSPRVPRTVVSQEFPYCAHTCDPLIPLSLGHLGFKYYRELGFNHLVMQGTDFSKPATAEFMRQYAAGLEAHNLFAFLHPDPSGAPKAHKLPRSDYGQFVLPAGKLATHYDDAYPDPLSPTLRKYAVDDVKRFMAVAGQYPQYRGAFCDDEWAWVMAYVNPYQGVPSIGSYSSWANDYFTQQTGLDAPPPVYREPGYVAPENDPWLKWCQVIRQDGYALYNKAITETAKAVRPDFLMSNYPGGFEGNMDMMVEEVYLDCWKESELQTLERMDVRSNFREDARRDKHPVWALIGIFRMPEDKAIYPESMRLMVGLSLGGGAKGVILWNGTNLWAPYMQHPGRDPLDREAQRLGAYLQRYGPMFLHLKKAASPVWMLSGWFWVNSFDNYYFLAPEKRDGFDMERTWWPIQQSEVAVPALLRAGLQMECVTEKQLLSKELFTKRAVVLPGMLYCREGVVKNLEAYIKQGGKVFVDQSTKVTIAGATVLPIDFSQWHADVAAGKRPIIQPNEEMYRKHRGMRDAYVNVVIPVLREAITRTTNPAVRIDSSEGVFSVMENGEATYLFVYNSNTDTGRTFTVTCRNYPSVAYDIAARKTVALKTATDGARFTVALPAGGWKVFAFVSHPLQRVAISEAAAKDKTLTLRVATLAANRQLFRAAVPVKITLRAPQGDTVLYRATDAGTLALTVPLAEGVVRPRSVVVEELFSGKRATATVQ